MNIFYINFYYCGIYGIGGSAEALNNYPRLNSSPTHVMRTFTPEPRGLGRGRRELPREPWRPHPPLTEPRMRREDLSFEQGVALGRNDDEFM